MEQNLKLNKVRLELEKGHKWVTDLARDLNKNLSSELIFLTLNQMTFSLIFENP